MIEKTIDGKTYRFRSMKFEEFHDEDGCEKCAANGKIRLCNYLEDYCLDSTSSYWKEHIKIVRIE